MNLTKGTYPFFNSGIQFLNIGGGQYEMLASITNPGPTAGAAQLLFYWAQAAAPVGTTLTPSPQLYGWSLPAYIQPYAPWTNPCASIIVPAASSVSTGIVWQPDATVVSSVLGSFDSAHIMIIAQLIYQSGGAVVAHPVDYCWWPGANSWVAAGVFSWP
jgi:hypothetical protein